MMKGMAGFWQVQHKQLKIKNPKRAKRVLAVGEFKLNQRLHHLNSILGS